MKGLDGKVALVSGGESDIGKSVALALAAHGVRVVVAGSDERALGETVGEIAYGGGKARHVAGDVRDASHVRAATSRAIDVFGSLDIVVANACQSGRVDLGTDLPRAEAILWTSLLGTYCTFDAAVPRMHGPGRLLATIGEFGGAFASGCVASQASKAGILGLVRAAAHELAPRRITCNAVIASSVDPDTHHELLAERLGSQEKARAAVSLPLGRFLQPAEVAELVVFLCSSAADGITGQSISIAAGAPTFGV